MIADPGRERGRAATHASESPRTTSPLSMARLHPRFHAMPHVIELLAPVFPSIPIDDTDESTVYSVTLRRTADGWLQLVFPELSKPGKLVVTDVAVACVNDAEGGCRCDFVRLLTNVLVLMEKQIFRITTKYVVTSLPRSPSSGSTHVRQTKVATLQVFVALHERVARSKTESLREFDLVLSHLQTGLLAAQAKADGHHYQEMVERAKRSRCHVIGCDLHQFKAETTPKKRFNLNDVFTQLVTSVEVDQMPIRDDVTYIARMKRARRVVILTDLPIASLHNLIRMLGARELAAVSAVCSVFQHLAYEVVPGLKLLLYSHQRKALKWLLYREGPTRKELTAMTHPFAFPAIAPVPTANPQSDDYQAKAIDLIDGRLVKQSSISHAADFRGGLFCDEPGLGKTITVLALILRTKGRRSDPSPVEQPAAAAEHKPRISLRSVESRGRVLDTNKLTPSKTTLIVVPNPLIDHWKFQIKAHLERKALNVYIDDLEFKTTLPTPEKLATYDVVITSFGRVNKEWKFHRPTSALEERMPDRYGYEDGPQRFIDGTENRGTSPLLLVHWVRLIVDEGHKLGGTNPTNHMKMARLFHVDSRWVMTGTPTPNTLQSADLRHMHGLLVFLRDRPYGHVDGKAWLKAIARPFEQNDRAGYVRLLQLLSRIMMRHTKESIQALIPTPIRHTVYLDPSPREYAMYNGVAAVVRANLVVTNMDPRKPGKLHPDSVLNPINRKHAMQVMKNLRDATCSGRRIRASLTEANYAETINMLHGLNVDPDRVEEVKAFMRKAEDIDFLTLCTLCGRHLQFLMLIPCGHLTCADCVEARYDAIGPSCGICNAVYDPEALQRLQPGFDFIGFEEEFAYNHGPIDGGIGTGGHHAPAGSASSRGGRNEGSTLPMTEPGIGNRRRIVPIDLARFETINASKAFYVATRVTELRKQYIEARVHQRPPNGTTWHTPLPPKVIIFSQFKEHIWRTKVALAQQGIECADFITGVSASWRMQSLQKFRQDPNSNVLVLTDVGSHGLDLSFVTHIFLMDEIWDKSLESQVVSRAHRMGARQSVVVEQLLMRGSVEEVMHKMNQRNSYGTEEAGDGQDHDHDAHARAHHHHRHGGNPRIRIKTEPTSNSMDGSDALLSKSTILQRQLQTVLQNLRLIEEGAVSEFGYVKFKVVQADGTVVRDSKLQLPNAGENPETAPTTSRSSTPSQSTSQSPATTVRNTTLNTFTPPVISTPLPPQSATSSTKAFTSKPKKTVRIADSFAAPSSPPTTRPVTTNANVVPAKAKTTVRITADGTPPDSTKKMPQVTKSNAAGKSKGKKKTKQVHVKKEPRVPAATSVKRATPSAVIDLTSDGDSDAATSPARRPHVHQQHYYGLYESRSDEEDDRDSGSETEDDWMPIKREVVVKQERIKSEPSSQSRAFGKRKRRIPLDEEDSDEDWIP